MYSFKAEEKKEFTDLDIFKFYLPKFKFGTVILSPLRSERTPSFSVFESKNGKLMWKDFGTGKSGTAVDLVMEMFCLTFIGALNKIKSDLGGFSVFIGVPVLSVKKKENSKIAIKNRVFSVLDLNYWLQYGIDIEILKRFNVYSISHHWSNNICFQHYINQLCFAYRFNDKFKIYKPNDKEYKWITNCDNTIVQGLDQLVMANKPSDLLIITKSLKDVMVLTTLGFNAIAPQSESIMLNKGIVSDLKIKYRYKNIVTLFDNDFTGLIAGSKYFDNYGFKRYTVPIGSGQKDISDFYKQFGREKTLELLKTIK